MSAAELDAALRRFLGVPGDADDLAVLNLGEPQARVPAAIDAAARTRTEQVRRHPGAGGPDAELVVARIGLAAARLRGRLAGRGPGRDGGPSASPSAGGASGPTSQTSPATPSRPVPGPTRGPTRGPTGGPAPTPVTSSSSPPPSPASPRQGVPTSPTARPLPLEATGEAAPPRPPAAPSALDRGGGVRRRPPSATASLQGRRTDGHGARASGRPDPASLPPLTAFDRAVLGTLVGHGGWNRRSRARLVALASSHGVGPRGLMNVVRGLAAYAGAGGRLADVTEMADDFAVIAGGRAAGLAAAGAPVIGSSAADEAAELTRRLIPELEADGIWPALKLSAIVLLLIGLVSIPLIRVLTPAPPPAAEGSMLDGGGPDGGGAGAAAAGRGSATNRRGGGGPGADGADGPGAENPLVFVRLPFIQGPPPAPELLDAADAIAGLPSIIDEEIVRRLGVAAAPSEATYRRWAALMVEVERGWTRAAPSDVRAVRRASVSAIAAAGERRPVVERLIGALRPPVGPEIGETDADGVPGSWAGSWRVSVLAGAAADPFAPAAGREACRELLQATVGFAGAPGTGTFDARPEAGPRLVAAAWLDLAAAELVRLLERGDDRTVADAPEAWERWLEAGEALDAASSVAVLGPRLTVAATESLLASSIRLDEPGVGAGLLGRLLQALPVPLPADLRDLVRRAHADSDLATTPDLRALGSILALRRDLPWFRATFVVPPGATPATRDRFLQRILAAWPESASGAESGRPLAVDAEELLAWREVLAAAQSMPEPLEPLEMVRHAARLGELAEAAHLLAAGRLREAAAVRQALDEELQRPVDRSGDAAARPVDVPGLALPDGAWTRSWEATRGRGEPALARLRALRTEAGRDLGPIDARTFAELVTRTGNQRTQEIARAILLEKFRDGPNVVLELLDALPEARIERGLREAIHRLTGVSLPADDDERWRSLARAALLEYAASVVGRDGDLASRLERRLAETLDRRAAVLERQRSLAAASGGPAVAAGRLADAWLAAASSRVAVQPVPAPAAELQRRDRLRRRLARDTVQSGVAALIGAAEGLAFVVAAEQPAIAEACAAVLERCRAERDRAGSATDQWLAVERAIIDLWVLRFGGSVGVDEEARR